MSVHARIAELGLPRAYEVNDIGLSRVEGETKRVEGLPLPDIDGIILLMAEVRAVLHRQGPVVDRLLERRAL